jgi:hypothetical protein
MDVGVLHRQPREGEVLSEEIELGYIMPDCLFIAELRVMGREYHYTLTVTKITHIAHYENFWSNQLCI